MSLLLFAGPAGSAQRADWMTGLPRTPIHVKTWPGGKKVAVCFILDVEVWGLGLGPMLRPEMASRKPDIVNDSFREYAISSGNARVGRLFNEEGVPLSIALNALFPEQQPDAWKQFRALVPHAPIVAHGMNNSTDQLPLDGTMAQQEAYIRKTVDLIQKDTGVRPRGWSSPSVYPNADTFSATTAAGLTFSIDGMDSDVLSSLATKSGPLLLMPYPTVTVDMGQYLARMKNPAEIESLWIDYITELAHEAELYPDRDATVLVIGVHPFVMGTPDGAASLRRVLENLKRQKLVWITDVQAVADTAHKEQ